MGLGEKPDKLEFDGLKKMLSLRTQTEACHCEPVRTLANPPDFQDTIIEQLPLFFCVYGRTGPVLADRKIRGIATPACALVRNDSIFFSPPNTNLSYRTDPCPAPFRGAAGAGRIANRTVTHKPFQYSARTYRLTRRVSRFFRFSASRHWRQ